MHRGTIFIITKDKKEQFSVQKSIEFNGGMGLDHCGKTIYKMLKNLKNPLQFDEMIRKFDNEFFKYNNKTMTYIVDSQENPYIDKDGNKYFEYSENKNQFKFFKDNERNYIYTSDSNYIKNLTNEDIKIVCCNGTYILKPNQILISDYDKCINNTKESFGKKVVDIQLDELENTKYLPTKQESIILDNIIKTLEAFDFYVYVLEENKMNNGLEIETWTNGKVNMIHNIDFQDDYFELYNIEKVAQEIQQIADNFSVDEEIEIYRQDEKYRKDFSIRESLDDFENYEDRLTNLSKKFLDKYYELIYKNYIKNNLEKELDIDMDY